MVFVNNLKANYFCFILFFQTREKSEQTNNEQRLPLKKRHYHMSSTTVHDSAEKSDSSIDSNQSKPTPEKTIEKHYPSKSHTSSKGAHSPSPNTRTSSSNSVPPAPVKSTPQSPSTHRAPLSVITSGKGNHGPLPSAKVCSPRHTSPAAPLACSTRSATKTIPPGEAPPTVKSGVKIPSSVTEKVHEKQPLSKVHHSTKTSSEPSQSDNDRCSKSSSSEGNGLLLSVGSSKEKRHSSVISNPKTTPSVITSVKSIPSKPSLVTSTPKIALNTRSASKATPNETNLLKPGSKTSCEKSSLKTPLSNRRGTSPSVVATKSSKDNATGLSKPSRESSVAVCKNSKDIATSSKSIKDASVVCSKSNKESPVISSEIKRDAFTASSKSNKEILSTSTKTNKEVFSISTRANKEVSSSINKANKDSSTFTNKSKMASVPVSKSKKDNSTVTTKTKNESSTCSSRTSKETSRAQEVSVVDTKANKENTTTKNDTQSPDKTKVKPQSSVTSMDKINSIKSSRERSLSEPSVKNAIASNTRSASKLASSPLDNKTSKQIKYPGTPRIKLEKKPPAGVFEPSAKVGGSEAIEKLIKFPDIPSKCVEDVVSRIKQRLQPVKEMEDISVKVGPVTTKRFIDDDEETGDIPKKRRVICDVRVQVTKLTKADFILKDVVDMGKHRIKVKRKKPINRTGFPVKKKKKKKLVLDHISLEPVSVSPPILEDQTKISVTTASLDESTPALSPMSKNDDLKKTKVEADLKKTKVETDLVKQEPEKITEEVQSTKIMAVKIKDDPASTAADNPPKGTSDEICSPVKEEKMIVDSDSSEENIPLGERMKLLEKTSLASDSLKTKVDVGTDNITTKEEKMQAEEESIVENGRSKDEKVVEKTRIDDEKPAKTIRTIVEQDKTDRLEKNTASEINSSTENKTVEKTIIKEDKMKTNLQTSVKLDENIPKTETKHVNDKCSEDKEEPHKLKTDSDRSTDSQINNSLKKEFRKFKKRKHEKRKSKRDTRGINDKVENDLKKVAIELQKIKDAAPMSEDESKDPHQSFTHLPLEEVEEDSEFTGNQTIGVENKLSESSDVRPASKRIMELRSKAVASERRKRKITLDEAEDIELPASPAATPTPLFSSEPKLSFAKRLRRNRDETEDRSVDDIC